MRLHFSGWRLLRHDFLATLLVVLALARVGVAQENAGMTIPPSLRDCYGNQSLLVRENLPPMGMSQLIELVRKVEAWPYQKLDLKNMAVMLTHRFRLDGIERDPSVRPSEDVIPFTPRGIEFFRHRILLTQLLPGNAYTFPNESLSLEERCTLHFMLSSAVNSLMRGDEDSVCNNLKNYENEAYGSSSYGSYGSYGGYGNQGSSGGYGNRGGSGGYGNPGVSGGYGNRGSSGGYYSSGVNYDRRRGRGPRTARQAKAGIESDVEMIDPTAFGSVPDATQETKGAGKRANLNYPQSRCPAQNGVLWTPWGAVNGGSVLGGIAAGMVPQSVQVQTLSTDARRSRYYSGRLPGLSAATQGAVDNKWAATFAGDLAEAALLQGPVQEDRMFVGLPGGWNSTLAPRWYFLKDLQLGAMTDADIRGDLDGLLLGTNAMEWNGRSSGALRLSQLLDMYYSERGVFSRDTRACLRRERSTDVASTQELEAQTVAFAKVLHSLNTFSVNLADEKIAQFSSIAVQKMQTYIPSNINDPPCTLSESDPIIRPYVDITLVMDTNFMYQDIHPVIGYLLEKIEAGKFGSNLTLLDAKEGRVLFNSTYPRLDWYSQYTREVHERAARGFDIMTALNAAIVKLRMEDAEMQRRRTLTGRGRVLLLLPQSNIGDGNRDALADRMRVFRENYPDVVVMVLVPGNKNAYGHLVKDSNRDAFALTITDPVSSLRPLVERLKTVPRRVRNPNCNPDWIETGNGNSEIADYVEPQGVNYYAIHPNNYFRSTEAKVKIQGVGFGTLSVCLSRTNSMPNGTQQNRDGVTCQQVNNNNLEISLTDGCYNDYYIKDCNPLYVSVSAASSTDSVGSFRCQGDDCRFPDMVKYSISVEKMGCWSGASTTQLSILLASILSLVFVLSVAQ